MKYDRNLSVSVIYNNGWIGNYHYLYKVFDNNRVIKTIEWHSQGIYKVIFYDWTFAYYKAMTAIDVFRRV
jgi:hypothetical protein